MSSVNEAAFDLVLSVEKTLQKPSIRGYIRLTYSPLGLISMSNPMFLNDQERLLYWMEVPPAQMKVWWVCLNY
jgi:hypothetical protein